MARLFQFVITRLVRVIQFKENWMARIKRAMTIKGNGGLVTLSS